MKAMSPIKTPETTGVLNLAVPHYKYLNPSSQQIPELFKIK
jgi:hypothetical protein